MGTVMILMGENPFRGPLFLHSFCFHRFAFCNTAFRFQKTVQVSVNEWAGFNSMLVEKKHEFCLCEEELNPATLALT
jgi:hypothetical protein